MKPTNILKPIQIYLTAGFVALGVSHQVQAAVELNLIGRYSSGVSNASASEIVAHDPKTQRLFIVNGSSQNRIDVVNIANPAAPGLAFSIDIAPYGSHANSVAVDKGLVAVAVEANVVTDLGKVVFFDVDGNYLNAVTAGSLPDMVTFTPNGRKVLVANEGEPNANYSVNPEGSVTIIDISRGIKKVTQADVVTAGFTQFNGLTLGPAIRIGTNDVTNAQDIEPEYIAISKDSATAWVTLQENNALGVLDIEAGVFTSLIGLGRKNHMLPGNGLDPSDQDGGNFIMNWPLLGIYEPDGITYFEQDDVAYLVMANEGEGRTFSTNYTDESTVAALPLDPTAFPDAALLKQTNALGRLIVSTIDGDIDGDGDFDELHSFGARSFTIRTTSGDVVFDSGDDFEQITALLFPANFNASSTSNTRDGRSRNKGPEPESVVIGHVNGKHYAFVGFERVGGIVVYDLTNPSNPQMVEYVNTRNFSAGPLTAAAGDVSPEGLLFIPKERSPNGKPLLVTANEISGTTAIFQFDN